MRQWNDYRYISDLKQGKWTTSELSKLRKLICRYAKKHDLTPEQVGEICSDDTPPNFTRIWRKLAKHFPQRSVQSVQNTCKRNFNPFNYKGPWMHWEEQELIRFVQTNGQKWKEIGQMLERTALNVKDKWKQMGGSRNGVRKTGPWAADELLWLVQLILTQLKLKQIDTEELNLNDSAEIINRIEKHVKKLKKKLTGMSVNWESISEKMLTRSSVDCRLKWNHFLYSKLQENSEFSVEDDIALYKAVKKQNPEELSDINFSKVTNSKTAPENRSRWKVLSKGIAGRLQMDIMEIVKKLEYAYEVSKPDQMTIIDYFKEYCKR